MRRWTVRLIALAATLGLLAAGAAAAVALMRPPDVQLNGRTLFDSVQDRSGSAATAGRRGT